MKAKNNTFKRSEMKYIVTERQKNAILAEIITNITDDIHKAYTICNLYCDTDDNRLIRTSIDNPVYKEKFRSRSYGRATEDGNVFLELKKKYEGIVYKRRITVKEKESSLYYAGLGNYDKQINKEIDYFFKYYKSVSPKMYIAYDREAYFATLDDTVRITFDSNILWRTEDLSLKSPIYGSSLLEDKTYVLEIKCSYAMPMWLSSALSKNKVYKTKYGKYGTAYAESVKQNLIKNKNNRESCQNV